MDKTIQPRPTQYHAYTLKTFRQIPQVAALSEAQKLVMEVVGNVLPFRVNNYVIDELIDWDNIPDDPIFTLTFPRKAMLRPKHFRVMAAALRRKASAQEITAIANRIRLQLNPHPAGQLQHNVPTLHGQKLTGMQHKYPETVLFFPSQGQTCHAYCTFCFRWPQFTGLTGLKFAMKETRLLVSYLREHPEVSDVLITGGDPMVMRTHALKMYIEPLLEADLPHLLTIRIGTKSLASWPYRYTTDPDADEALRLFEKVVEAGKHLTIMAHFNHYRELETQAVAEAVRRVRDTGAQIRTQSPLLARINDSPTVWARLWRKQVRMGMIPYYMFVMRDTGAQPCFGVPLVRCWNIFRTAYSQVSGVARTVRGPVASAKPGKIHILGVSERRGEKVFVLSFIQGRNPNWVARPFYAKYDERALWPGELVPAFGEQLFFFERDDLNVLKIGAGEIDARVVGA